MKNEIDWDAERERYEAWFAEIWGCDSDAFAPSAAEKNRAWGAWIAALTYGRQDAKPADDSDTIEVRIPVAVSDRNEVFSHRWHGAALKEDMQRASGVFDESQVHIITARVPKYRIPVIAADKVEPANTEDAT